MIKRFCDCCKEEIKESEGECKISFRFNNTERFVLAKHIKASLLHMLERDIDICNNCIATAFSSLDTRPKADISWLAPDKRLTFIKAGMKINISGPVGCGKSAAASLVKDFISAESNYKVAIEESETNVVLTVGG